MAVGKKPRSHRETACLVFGLRSTAATSSCDMRQANLAALNLAPISRRTTFSDPYTPTPFWLSSAGV